MRGPLLGGEVPRQAAAAGAAGAAPRRRAPTPNLYRGQLRHDCGAEHAPASAWATTRAAPLEAVGPGQRGQSCANGIAAAYVLFTFTFTYMYTATFLFAVPSCRPGRRGALWPRYGRRHDWKACTENRWPQGRSCVAVVTEVALVRHRKRSSCGTDHPGPGDPAFCDNLRCRHILAYECPFQVAWPMVDRCR